MTEDAPPGADRPEAPRGRTPPGGIPATVGGGSTPGVVRDGTHARLDVVFERRVWLRAGHLVWRIGTRRRDSSDVEGCT